MTEHGPRGCSTSFQVSGEFRQILEQRHHAADAVFEWLPPHRPEADGYVPGIARTAHSSRWLAKFLGTIGWKLRTVALGSGTAASLLDGSVGVSGQIGYKLRQPLAGLGELAEPSGEKSQYPLVQKQRQAATYGEAQKRKYRRMGER